MTPRVTDLADFVIRHGHTAEAVLGWDAQGRLPEGLTGEEQAAIRGVVPHLDAVWLGLLTACRAAVWQRAGRHAAAAALTARPAKGPTLRRDRGVVFRVVPDRVHAGIKLAAWGEPEIHLWGWIWAARDDQAAVHDAVAAVPTDLPWQKGDHGNLFRSLHVPRAGERFDDIGARVAEASWPALAAAYEAAVAGRAGEGSGR